MFQISRLFSLILAAGTSFFSLQGYAGEGEGHSHAPGGDMKAVAIVIAVLVVAGIAVNFWSKKKK